MLEEFCKLLKELITFAFHAKSGIQVRRYKELEAIHVAICCNVLPLPLRHGGRFDAKSSYLNTYEC